MNPPEGGPGTDESVGERRPEGEPSPPVRFRVAPNRLVMWLVVVWVAIPIALLLFDYHVNYAGVHVAGAIRRLANLAREDSLANLLAVIQVILLSLTLWAVYWTSRRVGESKWRRRGWLVVALLFSYIAIDDGARMHERVGSGAELVLEAWASSSGAELMDFFPSYAWQVVYLPIFAALGLFALYFFWKELRPKHSRTLIVLGIGCFVVAVGLDFLEGLDARHVLNPYTWITENFDIEEWTRHRFHSEPYSTLRHFSKAIEEVIEMLGTTAIWIAVLRHWMQSADELRIRFSGD
jgi:hypothetical protein